MHVYIPGAGHIIHWEQNFDVNRYPLSLWLTVASLKNFSLNCDLFSTFFSHYFRHVNSPGQGHITHWGQKFDASYPLSLWITVAKFIFFPLNCHFLHVFIILYMNIAQEQGHITPGARILMSIDTPCLVSITTRIPICFCEIIKILTR